MPNYSTIKRTNRANLRFNATARALVAAGGGTARFGGGKLYIAPELAAQYGGPVSLQSFGQGGGLGGGWGLGVVGAGGGGGGYGTDWSNLLLGGANVVGAYFDRKQQRKLLKQQARLQRNAMQGFGGSMYQNINPNLGASLTPGAQNWGMPTTAQPGGQYAAWQTAPIDPGMIFDEGGLQVTQAGLPIAAAGAAVAAGARAVAGSSLVRALMKYVAPAAAFALAESLMDDGVTAGGPYRTSAGNKALAYRGDLAACKRLRKLGGAIGYARATGTRRGSVRRGRRC